MLLRAFFCPSDRPSNHSVPLSATGGAHERLFLPHWDCSAFRRRRASVRARRRVLLLALEHVRCSRIAIECLLSTTSSRPISRPLGAACRRRVVVTAPSSSSAVSSWARPSAGSASFWRPAPYARPSDPSLRGLVRSRPAAVRRVISAGLRPPSHRPPVSPQHLGVGPPALALRPSPDERGPGQRQHRIRTMNPDASSVELKRRTDFQWLGSTTPTR